MSLDAASSAPPLVTAAAGLAPVTAVIADDEAFARDELRAGLERTGEVDILAECTNGAELVEAVIRLRPEVIFLDVEMPRMDGFTAISRLPQPTPPVIFVTAFDAHAVRAFEVNGFDYLLKPFTPARLQSSLARLRQRLGQGVAADTEPAAPVKGNKPYLTRFSVRQRELVSFVSADEVDWIEADGNYTVLHTGGRKHVLRENLGALERNLNPAVFVRVSRSAIVRLDRVRQIDTSFVGGYSLILTNGTRVKTSRSLNELSGLLKFS